MRHHIRALITRAAETVYCVKCGWWYPPHTH